MREIEEEKDRERDKERDTEIERERQRERETKRERDREGGRRWRPTQRQRLAPRDQMVSRSCAEENCSLGMVLLLVVPNGAPASSYSQGCVCSC